MLSVSESAELRAPASQVWRTVGDFGAAASYMAEVERCDLQGSGGDAERVLHMKDGGQVHERLILSSEADHALRYSIVESPLPVRDYVSTVRVDPLDDARCRITWSASFESRDGSDADARATIASIYQMGFAGLRRLHEPA